MRRRSPVASLRDRWRRRERRPYWIDLVGIAWGPLIVTAHERAGTLTIRCPVPSEQHPVEPRQLGQLLTCPGQGCTEQLRINPFIVHEAASGVPVSAASSPGGTEAPLR